MNKPKIRFKGFEGEWKERKIGDALSINSGRDYKHLEEGDIPVYGTGGYMLSVNERISDCDAIGIGRKGTIDKPQYLRAPFWTVDTLFFLIAKVGIDLDFAYNLSQVIGWRKYDESTGVPSLSKNNIEKIPISLPSLPEQRALASYFTALDAHIAASTSRLSSLKQIKAASLLNMFPQKGETVPRVRFKGFQGEWKEVKLSSIAIFSKGQGYSKSDLRENGHPIILYGRMYTKYQFAINEVDTFSNLKGAYVLSEGNEIIMPASGETSEDIACASAVLAKGIILGGDLNIVRFDLKKYSTPFLALTITYSKTHYDLSKCAQGKSVVHLHNEAISKTVVSIPSLPEQRAIASYFTALDAQITLHRERLEKLKQIKAACLEKMFA